MKAQTPVWWSTSLPWRSLKPSLPVVTLSRNKVNGLVVHHQGQYGWNEGNWVDDDPEGIAVHYGLDIIGWLDGCDARPLNRQVVCCSPVGGVVSFVGPDEHAYPSINLTHSPRNGTRRRFSFFGDLEEVFVRKGQRVEAGQPLGRPCVFKRGCRFFHFAMGYEVRRNGKWRDVFIDPGPSMNVRIVVRRQLPW